jgi:hypothetical protein
VVDEDHVPALEPIAREEMAVVVPKLEVTGAIRQTVQSRPEGVEQDEDAPSGIVF